MARPSLTGNQASLSRLDAKVEELARQYGTPLYVYDLDRVTAAWSNLRAALPPGHEVLYSLKANPHPAVVRHLVSLGAALDVSSAGELSAAHDARGDLARSLFTGPAKSDEDHDAGVHSGITVSVESADELRRLDSAAAARGASVSALLRVNPAPSPRAGLGMGSGSKFGMDEAAVLADLSALRASRSARLVGAHFFTGTNTPDAADLLAMFDACASSAAALQNAGLALDVLDLGGGFAAPYARRGERPDYAGMRDRLADVLRRVEGVGRVLFESGRYLVADSGVLVCRVVDVKRSAGRRFVLLDSGIHHLGGNPGLRRLPPLAPELLPVQEEESEPATFAGPLCTPLDVWATNVPAGSVRRGDLVVVPNVGAYGLTASLLAFLSHAAPVEVVLRGGDVQSATRLTISRQAVPGAAPW